MKKTKRLDDHPGWGGMEGYAVRGNLYSETEGSDTKIAEAVSKTSSTIKDEIIEDLFSPDEEVQENARNWAADQIWTE